MEKPQLGAGKAADCDASSPFSSTTSTAGLDSRHALSVGNRSYQSSSPSSPFMRSNHHMSMAMGTLDHAPHSSVDNSSHSADSCWSSVPAWEHQQSSAGNMEAGAAGDYASSGWDINWESFVPVSARGDGGRRMAASDFDLGGGGVPKSSGFNLGAASMASVAGGTSQKSFPAAFASSAPSGITSSSGIPGLAPTGGGAHGTFSTPSDHTFTPDSSVRNAGMDFRVKAEVDTPLGLEQQQEHPRKTGSLQDLRAYGQKTSPNAGVISDHKVDGMSSMDSPQQQQQPQSQQQPEQQQQQQRASSQASMLGMGNGIEQQRRLFLGLGGVVREVDDSLNNSSGSSKGPAGEDVKDGAHSNAVDGATVVGDLGLKLGRRTYFEDGPGGVSPATGARQSASSPSFAGSPPGKKQRSQPPVVQIPRCQVEGCKADLSNAKEYHRRHKVCEVHSKAAKVIVNKQEQRFCQQCSRFHELSEFDEGKRSCRRRLAGHNERRRKPQPDSGSAITCVNPSLQSASFYGDDDKRNGLGGYLHQRGGPTPTCIDDSDDGNSLKLNHGKSPWPSMSRMDEQSSLACQIQVTGAERSPYLSRVPLAHPATTSDRLLMLLQSSPKGQIAPMSSGMAGSGVHHFLQGSGPIGQGLTLSSSSGAGVLAGLEATPASQGLSGISDSGRALSLLSSQPWGSRAPGSGSLDLSPRSTLTLDQLLAENRAPLAQQLMSGSSAGGQQHFSPLVEKLSMQPHSPGNIGVSLSVNGTSSGERDHHHTSAFMSGYPDFGNNSMLALLQGQEIRALQTGNGQHVRPTIDLMQLPSPQSQSNHHASRLGPMQSQGGQYSDFALRSFESSMFDTQQML